MALLQSLRRPSQPPLVELVESVVTTVPISNVDRENGIIRNVKILGRTAPTKKREYTDKAIAEACRHYEGLEVNLNHTDAPNKSAVRPLAEGWGVIRNARAVLDSPIREDDGGYGDLHYLKSHPATPWLLERIDRGMKIGLSHNARGYSHVKGGKEIVESVPVVFSADLVSRPATVKNLFESEDAESITIAEFIATADKTADGYAALVEMASDAAVAAAPMEPPADGDNGIKAAILAAVNGKLANSDAAALEKVLNALGIEDSMTKNISGPDADKKEYSDAAMREALDARIDAKLHPFLEQREADAKELAALKNKDAARTLLESYRTNATIVGAEKFKELCECTDEAAMKTLIEALPPAKRGIDKPLSAAASQGNSAASISTNFASIRSVLRSR